MRRIKNKTKKRIIRHEQWIEIKRKDGETVVEFYPPNEQFEKERLEMDPPPDFIYRRMNFIHGVPDDFMWLNPDPLVRIYGGLFLQRILPADWPTILNLELATETARSCQPEMPSQGPKNSDLALAHSALRNEPIQAENRATITERHYRNIGNIAGVTRSH